LNSLDSSPSSTSLLVALNMSSSLDGGIPILADGLTSSGGGGDEGWGNSDGRDRDGNRRNQSPPPRRASRSRSPGRRNGAGEQNPGNNLHVSGLSGRVEQRDLEDLFQKYGRVKKVSIMLDPHTKESRGFGFVTMETPEEGDAAVAALNGQDFKGKNLVIEKARRGRARTPTPGKYYGPPKRGEYERPYDPRPYDSRYSDGRDDRYGGRGDRDRGRGGHGRYDDRDRHDGRYDDRRYDDRRY